MKPPAEQVREVLEAHEYLAPDPVTVYAGVEQRVRVYRRRRLAMQAAGGVAIGAGLVAGGLTLPGLLPGRGQATVVQAGALGGAPAATSSPAPSGQDPNDPFTPEQRRDIDTFYARGFGYDNAVQLAELWKLSGAYDAKIEGGRRLLNGETLPVAAKKDAEPTDSSSAADPDTRAADAFFAAGYDYDDAVTLAKLWKKAAPYDAKVEGGRRLLQRQALPIRPSGPRTSTAPDDASPNEAVEAPARKAFFGAGYVIDDAITLGRMWHIETYAAKIKAGQLIEHKQALPFAPNPKNAAEASSIAAQE